MLIAISDLHLIDHTAGLHSPSPEAFEHVFLPGVVSLARSRNADEIKLLLLGDTFELLRSEHWLRAEPEDRPWGEHGLADVAADGLVETGKTAEWCLRILGELPADGLQESVDPDSILYNNWKILSDIRNFPDTMRQALGRDIPVEVIYVPGNHDRLCNVYPRVRDQVVKILGLGLDDGSILKSESGQWWFRNSYANDHYGIFARHGQEFDYWNYGGGNDYTRRGHIKVPIGDVLGVEFATKLPYLVSLYQEEVPEITADLVRFMKEMGLVRPFTDAIQWLYFAIRREESAKVRDVLNEAFNNVAKEVLDIEFVQNWRSPHTRKDDLLRAASKRWLRWIPNLLIDRIDAEDLLPFFAGIGHNPRDPEEDLHLRAAYHEQMWRENPKTQFVLYGHTHFPAQRPLDAENDHEVMYINTGTWRDSIFKTTTFDTESDFLKLHQIAYSVIYNRNEQTDKKWPNTLSFETWAGASKALRRSRREPRSM